MTSAMLIVGAAGGVGMELTRLLCKRNYQVIATVKDDVQAIRLREKTGFEGQIIIMDLLDADTVKPALEPALEKLTCPLAGVAVCAAVGYPGPIETTPLADLRSTLEINTISNVAVYQACLGHLRESKGNLVMISSNAGRSGIPVLGYYVASKFALEGLADVMRRESMPFGVKVSLIEPGGIDTGMQNKAFEGIKQRLATLSSEEEKLYGYLFRSFRRQLHNSEAHLHPKTVAETMVEALEADKPKPRYAIGQDAIDLIDMAFKYSDEEIDEFYRSIFQDTGETTPMTLTKSSAATS